MVQARCKKCGNSGEIPTVEPGVFLYECCGRPVKCAVGAIDIFGSGKAWFCDKPAYVRVEFTCDNPHCSWIPWRYPESANRRKAGLPMTHKHTEAPMCQLHGVQEASQHRKAGDVLDKKTGKPRWPWNSNVQLLTWTDLQNLKAHDGPVIKLDADDGAPFGRPAKVAEDAKEAKMATGQFTVKEVSKGQWAVVEGDRVVAPFGARKGLAESYAKRLIKAGKPSGYDPKAPKPAAPKAEKPAKPAKAAPAQPAPATK